MKQEKNIYVIDTLVLKLFHIMPIITITGDFRMLVSRSERSEYEKI